ncbi:MAG: hypothetical protein M1819_001837 [Sarea resinae]|nr:MAG: hypothetical protein M1819_001837 [Sarea resinae]
MAAPIIHPLHLNASRTHSTISLPDMQSADVPRKLRVLVASTGPSAVEFAEKLVRRLAKQGNLSLQWILDHDAREDVSSELGRHFISRNVTFGSIAEHHDTTVAEFIHEEAATLSEWADLLILAPIDANTFAKMLYGITDNLLLELLRSWDVSKKILMVPGMSTLMWENPMTKEQLNKVRRKWNWVRVLQPVLWHYESRRGQTEKKILSWDWMDELIEAMRNQVDLMTIGQDVDLAMGAAFNGTAQDRQTKLKLPPEIWTIILDFLGDWEVSRALGIYTNIPTPPEWQRPPDLDESQDFMKDLEMTILTGTLEDVAAKLKSGPTPSYLSRLCVKLIIKFSWTSLLSFLESNYKDLFWATFGHTLIPTKSSAVFGKVEVLEWWRTSPSFLTREYTPEAVDLASKAGFIHVLDWWRKSGLPMRYTEAALEQASSKGNIEVLDWWKGASMHQGSYHIESDSSKYGISRSGATSITAIRPPTSNPPQSSTNIDPSYDEGSTYGGPLRLKVGKSICFAAQTGQAETVRWWDESGIPYAHEETVAKIASTYGHVSVLQLWKELKGEKMIYDNQVLVGPTKNGHSNVLEWWKTSGFKVEYKTCDIEEALEDSLGGLGEEKVRAWWARNGLNLGVGTSEWMKVKVL